MASQSDNLYSLRDVHFQYRLGSQKVDALRGLSLDIPRKAFACLSGPSGSGKTTLLNLLGLIEPVQKGNGSLLWERRELNALSEKEKNDLRRFRIGFIFQSFQLFPVLDAQENVEFFLSRQGLGKAERRKRAGEALEAVGLKDHTHKKPFEMSGGQRQRVAIARALAKKPEVILADEPTASLDQATGREIMTVLRGLHESFGVTLIVCSHDPMAQAFAPTQIRLRDGKLTENA